MNYNNWRSITITNTKYN